MLVQSIIAAVIPAVVYTTLIYYIDRYEKEPLWLLITTFIWGAVPAVILAIIFNGIFGLPFYAIFGDASDALVASIVAPLVEESIKGVMLLIIFFLWREQIDSLLDGIIYGAMVGMGFAMVENVFYFETVFAEEGFEAWQFNIFLRAVVFGLNHALFTSMTGLGVAYARMTPNLALRIVAPIMGWGVSVFMHALHNLAASSGDAFGAIVCIPLLANAWGGVLITAVIIVWALVQEQRWIQLHLRDEVTAGILTIQQYHIATSAFRRLGHRWQLLFSHGPRAYFTALQFYFLVSRFAYSKQHYQTLKDEKSASYVEKLRSQVSESSRVVL